MRYTPARAYLYKDRSSAILTLCTTSSWFKSRPPWSRKPQGVSNESLKSRTSIALFCSIFKLPSCKNIRFIYHEISFHLPAKPRRQDASWNATNANRMQGKVVNTAIRKINGICRQYRFLPRRREEIVCVCVWLHATLMFIAQNKMLSPQYYTDTLWILNDNEPDNGGVVKKDNSLHT